MNKSINEAMIGWQWNESLAQWERGDFRVVKYEDPNGRYYHRLLIRSAEHPECDCSAPCDIEDGIDAVCRTIVEVFREQKGIELKY